MASCDADMSLPLPAKQDGRVPPPLVVTPYRQRCADNGSPPTTTTLQLPPLKHLHAEETMTMVVGREVWVEGVAAASLTHAITAHKSTAAN